MSLEFDTRFETPHDLPVDAAAGVRRLTANNPGPFTFHGTNSYIVGRDNLAVIDPGPEDDAHFAALLKAIGGRPVSHIFVSHTHRDHSPLAAKLKQETGAIVCAEGPHRPARPLRIGEINPLDASADLEFVPDVRLADDSVIDGGGWRDTHRPDARPYRQPRRLRAGRDRHAVFGRPCDGLVDLDRGAAGRRHGRLHGLARQAARAPRQAVPARSWRPGHASRTTSCAG